MDKIPDVVSSLERALPGPELVWGTKTTCSPFGRVNTVLFIYVHFTQIFRVFRHLRARGLERSIADRYAGTSRAHSLLAIPSIKTHSRTASDAPRYEAPPAQRKLQEELSRVKVGIDDKLVPKSGEFTRYLTLPAQGKSAEWILEEMARMDKEPSMHADWRQGKLSGAIYRMSLLRRCSSCVTHWVGRRG